MKKVFLKGYLYLNLGDDLFFDIISKRYKNTKFISLTKYDYKMNSNIKFINYNKVKIISKLISLLTLKKYNYESLMIKNSLFSVVIGGSIFIEGKSSYNKKLFSNNDYYILGSNFGPYTSDEFYKKYELIFKNAKDVCFRDLKSYNLFKHLKSTRYASDIIFSLDTSNINIKEEKKVVISVIDVSKKVNEELKEKYLSKIIDMINYFESKNYKITLMSFCKSEGDEDAINDIIRRVGNRKSINTFFYNGNIDEALEEIASCKIVVGSRFHANILGLIMNKTIIPIAYSDKTINVLQDINFKGKYIDIESIDSFDVNELSDKDLSYKLNIDKYKEDANKHFEVLDKVLERN